MATSRKSLGYYPRELRVLFFALLSKPIIIKAYTPTQARLYRGRIYAFRDTVLNEVESEPKLALIAPLVQTQIIGNDLHLTLSEPKETSINDRDNRETSSVQTSTDFS